MVWGDASFMAGLLRMGLGRKVGPVPDLHKPKPGQNGLTTTTQSTATTPNTLISLKTRR